MKRSRVKNNCFKSIFSLLVIAIVFMASSCEFEDVSGPEPDPGPNPDPPPADTAGTVAPDGILETVTWNIENYDGRRATTDNAIKIVDSLKADLYAFQEIANQEALDEITGRMKGYHGFIAEEQPRSQHTAFVFNTQTIDSISSGLIEENQDYRDWASGRYPFFFSFNYKVDEQTEAIKIYAVVIHGKCCPDSESYERRKGAAQDLHTYLSRNKANANIVLLGDYNDDVDVSIYKEKETPYQSFVGNSDEFFVVTSSLSQDTISSTVKYGDMVDHITVSNEMEPFYVMDSVQRFKPTNEFIENYAGTTSDHYPIMAKFDIRK